MDRKAKRRILTIAAVLGILAAAFVVGNLLIDVRPAGTDKKHRLAPPDVSGETTVRKIFETFPPEGGLESNLLLLEKNSEAWSERWRLLAEARESIDVSYFILNRDIFGYSFLGHLLQKAQEGVRIRILLDALGNRLSWDIKGNEYLETLAGYGNVSVKIYRPWIFRFTRAFMTLNPMALAACNHDKIIIVDGKVAMLGGRNIGKEYFSDPSDDPVAFRDMDIILAGEEIGASLRTVFDEEFQSGQSYKIRPDAVDLVQPGGDLSLAYQAMDAWLRGSPIPKETIMAIGEMGFSWLDDLAKSPRLRGAISENRIQPIKGEVRLLDSRPRDLESGDPVSEGLIGLARGAKREILMQTPYLVLPEEMVSLLEEAAARKVRITVLTNSPLSSDNAPSQAFFLEQWPDLMARVPTLRLFVVGDRQNLHSKIGTIDQSLGLVGTYNIDPFSMAINGEVVAAVWSDAFAELLRDKMRRLIESGPPVVYEYRIALDGQGRPVRDREGKVEIAFGPKDHSTPEQWKAVNRFWSVLRTAKKFPGVSRLLWK